jgi:hypothetical protein
LLYDLALHYKAISVADMVLLSTICDGTGIIQST